MFGRIHALAFGLIAGLGIASAGAVTLPDPIAAVVAGLERSGYTNVRVTERIFGGFTIQGNKGNDFAMIALDAEGKMLDHAEMFRDADGDGVFETNETLGVAGRDALRTLVMSALAAPAGTTDRDVTFGLADTPGFAQNMESLFAPGGLRISAGQELGSGGIGFQEKMVSLDADAEGIQRRGERRVQQESMAGFGILSFSAQTAGSGGVTGSFAPLTVDAPTSVDAGVNAEEIRSSVNANAPDRTALQNSITAGAPNAAELTQQIVSAAPTAESIRAGITAPTAPSSP